MLKWKKQKSQKEFILLYFFVAIFFQWRVKNYLLIFHFSHFSFFYNFSLFSIHEFNKLNIPSYSLYYSRLHYFRATLYKYLERWEKNHKLTRQKIILVWFYFNTVPRLVLKIMAELISFLPLSFQNKPSYTFGEGNTVYHVFTPLLIDSCWNRCTTPTSWR